MGLICGRYLQFGPWNCHGLEFVASKPSWLSISWLSIPPSHKSHAPIFHKSNPSGLLQSTKINDFHRGGNWWFDLFVYPSYPPCMWMYVVGSTQIDFPQHMNGGSPQSLRSYFPVGTGHWPYIFLKKLPPEKDGLKKWRSSSICWILEFPIDLRFQRYGFETKCLLPWLRSTWDGQSHCLHLQGQAHYFFGTWEIFRENPDLETPLFFGTIVLWRKPKLVETCIFVASNAELSCRFTFRFWTSNCLMFGFQTFDRDSPRPPKKIQKSWTPGNSGKIIKLPSRNILEIISALFGIFFEVATRQKTTLNLGEDSTWSNVPAW